MLEATIFNNWCYGTSLKSLDKNAINVGVFNPEGVEILQSNPEIDIDVIYITAKDKVRLLRQLQREDNPDCDEIVRRYGTDKKDFAIHQKSHLRFCSKHRKGQKQRMSGNTFRLLPKTGCRITNLHNQSCQNLYHRL